MEGSNRAAFGVWIVSRLWEVGEHGGSTKDSSGFKFPGFTVFISSIFFSYFFYFFLAKWAAKQNKYCIKPFYSE